MHKHPEHLTNSETLCIPIYDSSISDCFVVILPHVTNEIAECLNNMSLHLVSRSA